MRAERENMPAMNRIEQRAAKLLVSVMSVQEARLAVDAGADIVDAKDPAAGALGALPLPMTRAIVAAVGGERPVSATIGDCALQDAPQRVQEAAATGVDFVKVGLFGELGPGGRAALRRCAEAEAKLIAVLLADQRPDLAVIEDIAEEGFHGVMLDTARKSGSGLREWMDDDVIAGFLAMARQHGLTAGLAGSLQQADVSDLLALEPDVLGFRGALCQDGVRGAQLSLRRLREMRALVPAQPAARPARTAAAGLMRAQGG